MSKLPTTVRQAILALVFFGLASAFMGCHTAHGFGKDVERTGEKIQEKTE